MNGNIIADEFIGHSNIFKGDVLSIIQGIKLQGTRIGNRQGLGTVHYKMLRV